MSRPIQFHNHPFRFLLYLEWVLLAIALSSFLTPDLSPLAIGLRRFQAETTGTPLLSFTGIFLFGLLGLWLPTGQRAIRIGHTGLQIALISLISLFSLGSSRFFPIMYLVLVIRSCFMYSLVGRMTITGFALLLFTIALRWRMQFILNQLPLRAAARLQSFLSNIQLNLIFLFALTLTFVLLLVNALLTERQSQEELKRVNAQLRQSNATIERLAMDQERNRIAREIHDSLGHSLTALNIQIEGALKLAQRHPQKAQAFLLEAKRLGSVALQEVRQSVGTLRGNPLQGQSLQTALNSLISHFQKSTGLQPTATIDLPAAIPDNVQVALYRILQEGLTNIVKHAQATAVWVQISHVTDQITLSLADNGRGFEPTQTATGYGLQGLQERAEALGGHLTLTSHPGQGSQITITLPLQSNSHSRLQ